MGAADSEAAALAMLHAVCRCLTSINDSHGEPGRCAAMRLALAAEDLTYLLAPKKKARACIGLDGAARQIVGELRRLGVTKDSRK